MKGRWLQEVTRRRCLGTASISSIPAENLDLYRRIAATGAVLSEFPLGRSADRQSFAMRNRIVSGMSSAVVVVESAVDGGAMITAKFAGEQGPPSLRSAGSHRPGHESGCHQLIRDGATLVTSVDEILEEMNYLGGMRPFAVASQAEDDPAQLALKSALAPEEQTILACFNRRGDSCRRHDCRTPWRIRLCRRRHPDDARTQAPRGPPH